MNEIFTVFIHKLKNSFCNNFYRRKFLLKTPVLVIIKPLEFPKLQLWCPQIFGDVGRLIDIF